MDPGSKAASTPTEAVPRHPGPMRPAPPDLLDGLDAIVWEMDASTWRFTFVSAGAERLLGYPIARWLEPDFWREHLHPDDRLGAVAFCENCVTRGCDHELEYRMLAADGRAVWLRDLVHVLPAQDGGPTLLHGVMVDISAQKELEARLRASEERFARFSDASIDGVAVHAKGRILDVNVTLARMLGYEPSELLGCSPSDLTIPEQRGRLVAHIASGSEAPIEGLALTKQGGTLPVEIWPRNFGSGDAMARLVIVRDISARRRAEDAIRESEARRHRLAGALGESEARYRGLVESMPDGVLVHAGDRIVFVNPACVAMAGAARAEELLGRSVFDLVHPDELADVAARLREVEMGTVPVRATRRRLVRLDGGSVEVEVSATTLDYGGERAVQVVLRDVSERQRTEAALHDAELRLQQSQKLEAIGRLAGGIAHDFNNLLTVITVYTQMVLEGMPPADPRVADLYEVQGAARRAADLTRQLLAFSRKQVMQPQVLDLNAVVQDVEKMLRRVIGEDVRLVTSPAKGEATIRADRNQLEQVLMNLAVNARDAMPNGGRLHISTEQLDVSRTPAAADADAAPGPARWVRLEVRDTGIGMDEAVRARVFEPFFTTKAMGRGTGLGLATVYGIVKQSGGYITVDSVPGLGTAFSLYFPVAGAPLERQRAETDLPLPRGTETILLVEDEHAVREVAQRILVECGYHVLVASHAHEALALAREHHGRIDLLLTDLVMPDVGGRELAARITGADPRISVMFMSGYTDQQILGSHADAEQDADLILKPFAIEAFAGRVRAALDRRRA